jgi:hypothetical protein
MRRTQSIGLDIEREGERCQAQILSTKHDLEKALLDTLRLLRNALMGPKYRIYQLYPLF